MKMNVDGIKYKKNGFKYKKNGWTYISIQGEPYERGFAHGSLLKAEIKKCISTMEWNLYDSHGLKMDFFKEISNFFFKKTNTIQIKSSR